MGKVSQEKCYNFAKYGMDLLETVLLSIVKGSDYPILYTVNQLIDLRPKLLPTLKALKASAASAPRSSAPASFIA